MTPEKHPPLEAQTTPQMADHPPDAAGSSRSEESWSSTAAPVFVVDDSFFRTRTPRNMHWSIAWSDLMMTMFILFLSLFVYQLAHRDFLADQTPEVIAGTAMPVPQSAESLGFTFSPIAPSLQESEGQPPLTQAEPVQPDPIDALFNSPARQPRRPSPPPAPETDISPEEAPLQQDPIPQATVEPSPAPPPARLDQPTPDKELFTEIYDLSKVALEQDRLERFASVELIPDKAMRIILTGDLLFDSGQAELTPSALALLGKLAAIIKQSPYMINVVGHTDSVPMSSPKYPTNWELSTARASRVARYLIEDAHIPATQVVASGYSHYRPVRPNDSPAHRRANRRVEIILSKEPAPAIDASPLNESGPTP